MGACYLHARESRAYGPVRTCVVLGAVRDRPPRSLFGWGTQADEIAGGGSWPLILRGSESWRMIGWRWCLQTDFRPTIGRYRFWGRLQAVAGDVAEPRAGAYALWSQRHWAFCAQDSNGGLVSGAHKALITTGT